MTLTRSHRLATHGRFIATLIVLLTLLNTSAPTQSGTTRTWDGGGADNSWSTAGNWSADDAPDSASEAALFTNDAVGQTKLTANLPANVTIGQLQFSATAPSYNITGTGPAILFLSPAGSYGGVGLTVASGAANQTISAAEVAFLSTQTWDIGGTTTLTVTSTMEDDSVIDYGLTKNGTGTLVFPGDVRYDGPTVVNAGAIVLSFSNTSMLSALTVNGGLLRATTSVNALGNSSTRNGITLAGGALELANNTGLTFGSTSRITTLTGNATIRSDRLTAGAGVTHTLGTLRIGTQTLSVTAGANVTSGTAGTTFGGTTLQGNATISVVNTGSAGAQLTLGALGQSGGTRSLTKTGSGTLLLNGTASYTGSTTLSQGAITLGVANALGSGGFTFAGGALNANNTTDSTIGALTLSGDSTLRLSPGGAAATLTFGGVSGAATGILTVTGWSGSAGGLGTNDKIVFSGGTAPSADFLQHIHFDLGDGKAYVGAIGAGGELFPVAAATGPIVPSVVNLTQAAATTAIIGAGFVLGNVTTAMSATVGSGSVISQSPAGGASATAGSAVDLVVSTGPPPALVPNVVGKTQTQASSTLTAAGLIASVTTQPSPTIPLGNVMSQNPAAGTSVPTGSTVSLVVSGGVVVPDVVGQTQSAATAAITTAGFVVTSSTQASASVQSGSVVSQNPTGGAPASGGSTVALVISSGPPANITLANVQSAVNTTAGSFVDLAYTVPNLTGSQLLLVVYGGAEASTTNFGLPAGATFHGVAMNVGAQLRTPATGINAGSGLYWLPVSPNESGTIRLTFTGSCDERAIGAVTLVGAALTGPEAVKASTGTGALTDQITTLSPNAMVISTATQGNNGALTATGTGHLLDVSAALASSRMAGGHSEVATPSGRTLGYSGTINRIAMILASFPVGAPPTSVVVPDVTSIPQATAQSTLLAAGLQPGVITTAYNPGVPATYVISQNPASGTSVPGGSGINLLVSLGAQPNAPPTVALTAPADHVIGVGTSAMLMATVTDTDATTVTFYGRKTVPTVPGPDFTLGVLPDTQYYSQNTGGTLAATFYTQTQWYADMRSALNIAFISHMGDMVQSADNGSNNSEWNIADTAMRFLEDPARTGVSYGIPWGGAPGNHDQTTVGQVNAPNAKWNLFFGADRWAGRPYFGGSFSPTNNSNNYELFTASGLEFLIIHLDYTTAAGVNQAVIDWADALMKAYPQRRAIVTSHWILDVPAASPVGAAAPFGGPGQRFFDEFKDNPNFFLMLSGHQHGEGRRTEVFGGRSIYAVLQDFQERANGGDGWLRYFVFSPAGNTITAKTYSPTLDRFETDTDATSSPANQASEFVLPYNMQTAVAPWTVLGAVGVPAGGGAAQFNWTGLEPNSTYEWYVTASDGASTTTSVVRSFATSGTAAPTVALTSPTGGAIFSAPASVTLTAAAGDADGFVTKVEFYDGATKLGQDTTPPYSYTWTSPSVGGHLLTAVVTDNTSVTTTSSAVAITVNTAANLPPTVALTAPANNAVFAASANITLTATAGDTDGTVSKVEFFQGATKLGEDATSPYSFGWTSVPAGTYTLTARATDNSNATTTSSPVNIVVNTSPTVALTAPASGAIFTTPVTITLTANAADADGTVTLVEFYSGATKLGEDATSPYSFTWTNPAAGSYTLTARATDNRGATTVTSSVSIQVNGTTPAGLVAAYDFDDGSGTILTDVTGRGHNGTISAATWTASGHAGSALTFGGSARVTVPDANDLDLTTALTLEAWVYPTAVPTDFTTVVLKENSPSLAYALYAGTPANRPEGYVHIGVDQGVTGTAALPQNAWSHLAATYDGATLRLYVNGVQVVSRSITGATQTSSGILSIGGNGVWGEYFRGRLDDLRIYNRALTAAEVQTDMNTAVNLLRTP